MKKEIPINGFGWFPTHITPIRISNCETTVPKESSPNFAYNIKRIN